MPTRDDIIRLRRDLARVARESGFAMPSAPIGFGADMLDRAVGGGLPRALHEIFARGPDGAAASGFALALMLRALEPGRKIIWIRQDVVAQEQGDLYPPGLAEFGVNPSAVIAVHVRDAVSALRAANEALRCRALGAVAIELWGQPKTLDLTATRRLARAAEKAGTFALLIRFAAEPQPTAALSRWSVRAAPSVQLAGGAPGASSFYLDLLRHRAGFPPRSFCVEWNRDECVFRDAALSSAVAAATADRPAASAEAPFRRTG